ncbi:MAG: hypothetical protein WCI46_09765 [Verrucomicrobiota bacterium]
MLEIKAASPSKPSAPVASKPGANKLPVIGAISLITAAVTATLKQPELIAGIVHAESVSRGAYSAFGKYRYFLEKRLAAEKSSAMITALLREKCGLTVHRAGFQHGLLGKRRLAGLERR